MSQLDPSTIEEELQTPIDMEENVSSGMDTKESGDDAEEQTSPPPLKKRKSVRMKTKEEKQLAQKKRIATLAKKKKEEAQSYTTLLTKMNQMEDMLAATTKAIDNAMSNYEKSYMNYIQQLQQLTTYLNEVSDKVNRIEIGVGIKNENALPRFSPIMKPQPSSPSKQQELYMDADSHKYGTNDNLIFF